MMVNFCKGDDCEEVQYGEYVSFEHLLFLFLFFVLFFFLGGVGGVDFCL